MNQQKIEFQKYRDFGQIINASFEFIKQNFGSLLKSLTFIVGPFLLVTGILLGFYQKSIFSLYNMTSLSEMGIVFVLLIISVFLTVQMLLVTSYSFILIYLEKPEFFVIQIEEVWEGVKKNFLKVLGITFFLILLSIVAIIVFGVLVVVSINATSNPFLVFLLFLLWMIPFGYLMVKLTLIYMVSLYEKSGVIQSMQRSFYLTKNKWWFTFGLVFVLGLIEAFMGFVFQIPQYIVMFATMFNSMDGTGVDGVTEIIIIVTSVISAFQYLLYFISIIALAFYYFSLVEQKEAKGLLEKIESI
ncbi:MAG: hypothetical protein WAU11_13580 [Ignavibacteriaceae bacterium]|jgi:hypothetical protein